MNTLITTFDSLDESNYDWIDEIFYHWCNNNDVDYYTDESDYPSEFKEYYITNHF